MGELKQNQFRSKGGICTITSDEISFSNEAVKGASAKSPASASRGSPLFLVFGSLVFGYGIYLFLQGDTMLAAIIMLVGLAFPWLALRGRQSSDMPIIKRKKIRQVQVHSPLPPLTRGYFTIHFEEEGALHQQRIIMPGSFSSGGKEFEHAVQVMRETGLLTQE
jgi:hypothetical protein